MTGELSPGVVLGGYRIETPLGQGGMATVWRASRMQDGAQVALKVLAPQLAEMPSHVERFLREAQACTRLQHPTIVRVFEGGRQGAHLWIAMELLDGMSLASRLAQGPLRVADALWVARSIADALRYAHGHGVLHRDVKPANTFLLRDGTVKLLDFGVARVADNETLTATGEMVGTATHMAPELCRGERATVATDLYAVGITLFEALTGRLPFVGNAMKLVVAHARSVPPRVRMYNPEVPDAVDALVFQLLAKDPRERVPDAATLVQTLDALGAVMPTLPTSATASPEDERARIERMLVAVVEELSRRAELLRDAVQTARSAREEARGALSSFGVAANTWLQGDSTWELTAAGSEARWTATRDRVIACDRAVHAARAALAEVEAQAEPLRARLAALR